MAKSGMGMEVKMCEAGEYQGTLLLGREVGDFSSEGYQHLGMRIKMKLGNGGAHNNTECNGSFYVPT